MPSRLEDEHDDRQRPDVHPGNGGSTDRQARVGEVLLHSVSRGVKPSAQRRESPRRAGDFAVDAIDDETQLEEDRTEHERPAIARREGTRSPQPHRERDEGHGIRAHVQPQGQARERLGETPHDERRIEAIVHAVRLQLPDALIGHGGYGLGCRDRVSRTSKPWDVNELDRLARDARADDGAGDELNDLVVTFACSKISRLHGIRCHPDGLPDGHGVLQ